ncbi:MAG: xanthine dehydrogenase family protein [Acidobacteria bacterium]|nr:xanthine dehydrogenase family protein [Acidobacteriota bacterium]
MAEGWIGEAVPRKEGAAKVTGRSLYVDDLHMEGVLYGVTVRSTVARGRLEKIRFDPAFPWDDCVIVTAADIPGRNAISLILDDQPCLAASAVNHAEEPVLLIAHPDRYMAEEARRSVTIDYAPQPSVLSMEDALAGHEIIWGRDRDNVLKRFTVVKGDVEAGFRQAHWVIDGDYETGAQEQLYIEPQGMLATASPESGVTVWGSMQCPYYVHKALMSVFGLPEEKVRVVQCETGGGFGGKEDYPSMIAAHTALLAWKSGRPVKMIYDRAEDISATTKRHPSRTRHRTAVSADGRLLAMDVDFTLDGGAYCTLSPVVLSRGTIHAAGPYRCDNVTIRSRAVATNHPPHGAFRGFGAPQSIFALERHMDRIARTVGLDPAEFRRRNFLRQGDTTATGQVLREPVDLPGLLDRALGESRYKEKRAAVATAGAIASPRRGIGLAAFMHGAGFTGSGERYLQSVVAVEATVEGKALLLVSSAEIGQGANTVLCQIAAAARGISSEQVEVVQPDTARVPNSGPTVASRTTMVVGKLVESAALGLLKTLEQSGLLAGRDFSEACREYLRRHGELKSWSRYEAPEGLWWDDETYSGDAYGAFAWAVYVAEAAVDPVTFETRVTDFVAVQEIGRVLNPVLAEGQIQGGVAQGIGWALYEDVVYDAGRVANAQMTNYIMPTSADLPPIRVVFLETPYAAGPGGAKGIGELPMDGPAPAVLNAVEEALGVSVNRIPLTPERLLEVLDA